MLIFYTIQSIACLPFAKIRLKSDQGNKASNFKKLYERRQKYPISSICLKKEYEVLSFFSKLISAGHITQQKTTKSCLTSNHLGISPKGGKRQHYLGIYQRHGGE